MKTLALLGLLLALSTPALADNSQPGSSELSAGQNAVSGVAAVPGADGVKADNPNDLRPQTPKVSKD